MVVNPMKPFRVFILGLSLSLAACATGASQSVDTSIPVVGNCYVLVEDDQYSTNMVRPPVGCENGHNSETFRVARWSWESDPNQIIAEAEKEMKSLRPGAAEKLRQQLQSDANAVCSLPTNLKALGFDYSFWFFPTTAQWESGMRSIRCDAVIEAEGSNNAYIALKVWTGRLVP